MCVKKYHNFKIILIITKGVNAIKVIRVISGRRCITGIRGIGGIHKSHKGNIADSVGALVRGGTNRGRCFKYRDPAPSFGTPHVLTLQLNPL